MEHQVEILCLFLQDRLENHFYDFFHNIVVTAAWTQCKQKCEKEHGIPVDKIDIHRDPFDGYCFDEIRIACEAIKRQEFSAKSIEDLFNSIIHHHRYLQSLIMCLYETQIFLIMGRNQDISSPDTAPKILKKFLRSTLYFCADQFARIPCVLDVRCQPDDAIKRYNIAMQHIHSSIIKATRTLLPVQKIINAVQQRVYPHPPPAPHPVHQHPLQVPHQQQQQQQYNNTNEITTRLHAMTRKVIGENTLLKNQIAQMNQKLVAAQQLQHHYPFAPPPTTTTTSSVSSHVPVAPPSPTSSDLYNHASNSSIDYDNKYNDFFDYNSSSSPPSNSHEINYSQSNLSSSSSTTYNNVPAPSSITYNNNDPAAWFKDDDHHLGAPLSPPSHN